MGERLSVIEKNNLKFLLVDMAGLGEEEIIKTFPKMEEVATSKNIRLIILDITNTFTNQKVKEASKQSVDEMKKKLVKFKVALVGLRGLQKIIANTINSEQYFAKDQDDAIKWLTEQAQKMQI